MFNDWQKKLEAALQKMPSPSKVAKAREKGDLSLEARAITREIIERALELEHKIELSVDPHTVQWSTLTCLNCGSDLTWASLYCSEYCKQVAKDIRYARKSINEGKIKEKDIQDAIGIRLLMLSGGGYPVAERTLSPELRTAVFERDNYICRRCGKEATQIDHIAGNSNELSNLQALCEDCNFEKALDGLTFITEETHPEEWARQQQFYDSIALRIATSIPLRICDDSDNWEKLWREILKARRKLAPSRYSKPKQTS
jgi:hypothetical protein